MHMNDDTNSDDENTCAETDYDVFGDRLS
jgi:hypothetical protein